LLQYYSKKYGTTIYHSVNMSESYVVKNGKVNQRRKSHNWVEGNTNTLRYRSRSLTLVLGMH